MYFFIYGTISVILQRYASFIIMTIFQQMLLCAGGLGLAAGGAMLDFFPFI